MEPDSPFFPEDFLFKEILPKLGTKSLMALKSVSKSWLARITGDSTFKADHAAHHQFEDCKLMGAAHWDSNDNEPVYKLSFIGPRSSELVEIDTDCIPGALNREINDLYLMGSGNGLICLVGFFSNQIVETKEFVVWNPVTKEVKCVLLPPLHSINLPRIATRVGFCFGVGKGSDDFKILCLSEIAGDRRAFRTECINAHVFHRSSGSWRQLNCSLLGFKFIGDNLMGIGQALTLDGTVYWAIYRYVDPDNRPFHILSFDLCSEKFQELEGPPCGLIGEAFEFKELIEWNGHLGAVFTNKGLTEYLVRTNSAWTKMVTALDLSYHPHQYLGSLGTRLIVRKFHAPKKVLYHVTSHEASELRDTPIEISVICGHSHTLLSPN